MGFSGYIDFDADYLGLAASMGIDFDAGYIGIDIDFLWFSMGVGYDWNAE